MTNVLEQRFAENFEMFPKERKMNKLTKDKMRVLTKENLLSALSVSFPESFSVKSAAESKVVCTIFSILFTVFYSTSSLEKSASFSTLKVKVIISTYLLALYSNYMNIHYRKGQRKDVQLL